MSTRVFPRFLCNCDWFRTLLSVSLSNEDIAEAQKISVMKPKRNVWFYTDLFVNGRIILQCTVRKESTTIWFGFVCNTFSVMKTKKRVLFCIYLSVNGRIILQWIVRKQVISMWFGFVWNTIGPLIGLYKMWQIFGLHKMRQTSINRAAVKLLWITLIYVAALLIMPNAIIHFMYFTSWYGCCDIHNFVFMCDIPLCYGKVLYKICFS